MSDEPADRRGEASPDRPGSRSLPILVAVGLICLLALLPDLGPGVAPGGTPGAPGRPSAEAPVEAYRGRIESIGSAPADGPFRPPDARVVLLEGPRAGETVDAYLEGPGGSQIVAGYRPGDEVVVTITQGPEGDPYIAVGDRWRLPVLGVLILLFAAAVVLIGGWQGARALVALGLTIAVVLKVLVPLVIDGAPPVPLAVVTATFVTVATILLTEGPSRASAAAILGVAAALSLTGLLSIATTVVAGFTYSAGSDLAFLQTAGGAGIDLRGLLLAAFILGAVGVLDDVTVTQAAVVDGLAARGAGSRDLVAESMKVGRSHIAATVNTLFLAYLGAGLPLLVVLVVSQQPMALVLNSEEIAIEVVRTIVGSLGIIAAVPITTLFAVTLVSRPVRRAGPRSRDPIVLVAGAVGLIAVLLAATALVPLGPARPPLPREPFDPGGIPGDGGTGAGSSPSPDLGSPFPEPSEPEPEPDLAYPGDRVTVDDGGATVEITVDRVEVAPADRGATVRIEVGYRNDGPDSYAVDPTRWSVLAGDGQVSPMDPAASGGLRASIIGPGASAAGVLEGRVGAPGNGFVVFGREDGSIAFAVVLPEP